jgi:hypothetical protein
MSNETSDDDGATENGQPEPACVEPALDEELRELSEHVRRVQLETEARILTRWKKRGLFGLTTSTG